MTHRARSMRRAPTRAEAALWDMLRGDQNNGARFRRQLVIGPYIADFACLERRLILEVDGGAHDDPAYDCARDAWLQSQGFRVVRLANEEVLHASRAVRVHITNLLILPPLRRKDGPRSAAG